MKPMVDITLIELNDRKNPWYHDYAISEVVDKNRRPLLYFAEYPDWDFLYGKFLIYQYFFN